MSKQQQILTVFKPNTWLNKADIARASGVDIDMVGYYLKQLGDEGKLMAVGATGDRRFALAGTTGTPPARTPDAPPPQGRQGPAQGIHQEARQGAEAESGQAPARGRTLQRHPVHPGDDRRPAHGHHRRQRAAHVLDRADAEHCGPGARQLRGGITP